MSYMRDKRLDMGHARALLTISDPSLQLKLYNEILRRGLSVRKVEELAKAYENGESPAVPEKSGPAESKFRSGDFDILKKHLSSAGSHATRRVKAASHSRSATTTNSSA